MDPYRSPVGDTLLGILIYRDLAKALTKDPLIGILIWTFYKPLLTGILLPLMSLKARKSQGLLVGRCPHRRLRWTGSAARMRFSRAEDEGLGLSFRA